MITDADVKKLERTFATKKYLDEKLNDSESRLNKKIDGMKTYIDFQLEPVHEFVKEFKEFKNQIFDKLDWLINKYTKFDEELTVMSEQNKRINIKLDGHEIRIVNLEQKMVNL